MSYLQNKAFLIKLNQSTGLWAVTICDQTWQSESLNTAMNVFGKKETSLWYSKCQQRLNGKNELSSAEYSQKSSCRVVVQTDCPDMLRQRPSCPVCSGPQGGGGGGWYWSRATCWMRQRSSESIGSDSCKENSSAQGLQSTTFIKLKPFCMQHL